MMHRVKDGPTRWGQEVYHGILLELEMPASAGICRHGRLRWMDLCPGGAGNRTSRLTHVEILPPGLPLVGLLRVIRLHGSFGSRPLSEGEHLLQGKIPGRHDKRGDFEREENHPVLASSPDVRHSALASPLAGIAYTVASPGQESPSPYPPCSLRSSAISLVLLSQNVTGSSMETFDTSDLQPE